MLNRPSRTLVGKAGTSGRSPEQRCQPGLYGFSTRFYCSRQARPVVLSGPDFAFKERCTMFLPVFYRFCLALIHELPCPCRKHGTAIGIGGTFFQLVRGVQCGIAPADGGAAQGRCGASCQSCSRGKGSGRGLAKAVGAPLPAVAFFPFSAWVHHAGAGFAD